eukprot:4873435-Prorocentrum_lima.AAC.1
MEKIPKYWRAEFMVKNLGKHGLTTQKLSQIDAGLPNAINEMFDFLLAFHSKTKIPRVCLDKSIMMSFFTERLTEIGRGTHEWLMALTDNFAQPHVLNWAGAGCCSVLKEQDEL